MSNTDSTHHDAPLVALVGKSPADMDDNELRLYVATIRELRATPQTRIAAIRAPEAKKQPKPTIDIGQYLS